MCPVLKRPVPYVSSRKFRKHVKGSNTHHDHVSAGDVGPHAVQVDQHAAVRLRAGAVAAGPEEVHRQALWHRLYAPRQVCARARLG